MFRSLRVRMCPGRFCSTWIRPDTRTSYAFQPKTGVSPWRAVAQIGKRTIFIKSFLHRVFNLLISQQMNFDSILISIKNRFGQQPVNIGHYVLCQGLTPLSYCSLEILNFDSIKIQLRIFFTDFLCNLKKCHNSSQMDLSPRIIILNQNYFILFLSCYLYCDIRLNINIKNKGFGHNAISRIRLRSFEPVSQLYF